MYFFQELCQDMDNRREDMKWLVQKLDQVNYVFFQFFTWSFGHYYICLRDYANFPPASEASREVASREVANFYNIPHQLKNQNLIKKSVQVWVPELLWLAPFCLFLPKKAIFNTKIAT